MKKIFKIEWEKGFQPSIQALKIILYKHYGRMFKVIELPSQESKPIEKVKGYPPTSFYDEKTEIELSMYVLSLKENQDKIIDHINKEA